MTGRRDMGVNEMMTVHKVSRLTGVSVRTLHYYDQIGLLHPAGHTDSGYRLYEEADLARLQDILFFRELEFPLKDIKAILDQPDLNREKLLEQQIELLRLKKEHIENLLSFAEEIKTHGGKHMDFKPFDRSKLEAYARQAKELYGDSEQYKEMQAKAGNRTSDEEALLADRFMLLFKEAGELKNGRPDSPEAQNLVRRIQRFITDHMYRCTTPILRSLGKMYSGGGEMTQNIDSTGGAGTGEFVDRAIQIYCDRAETESSAEK